MKRLRINTVYIALWVVCLLVCGGEPGTTRASDTEARGAGRPLAYWISQAVGTDRSEDLDTIVQALAEAVASSDPTAKVAAADALATLGRAAEPALPVLLDQQSHELGWVRSAAASAVAAMGKAAVPAVQELFEKQIGAPSVRAAFLLGAMGSDAKSSVPAIVKIMEGASSVMQARYADILNQIDPENFYGNTTSDTLRAGRVTLDESVPGAPLSPFSRDWPQFHGPNRDSICHERGLLTEWPEGGPTCLWVLEGLGKGYSGLAIVGTRMFTMGDRLTEAEERVQQVVAFDRNTRAELWATKVGPPFKDGPRCTPTVVGDRVYALGTEGDLVCLDTATGKAHWRRNLVDEFGGKMMSGWKYSESPLVDGDRLFCTPGGADGAVVALDRHSGQVLWRCVLPDLGVKGADGAAYASAVIADIQGIRQVVQILGRGVVGIEAETGESLWGYNRIACNVANVTTPVVQGNYVFVTTAYNTGSALLEIMRQGDRFHAEELYFLKGRDFQNHHGGVVLADGNLYGGNGNNSGHPTCIDLATGEICWSERSPARGSASVLFAEGHVILRYDRGDVVLVEATPQAMRVKGHFTAVKGDGAAWAHPVIHQGRLYLRHGDLLACYDLRAID